MKNKLTDLNDHLFMQMERLNDDDLKGDALQQEIRRAESMVGVAEQIISNGALALKVKLVMTGKEIDGGIPKMLES